jgi:hypothetical protein
MALTAIDGCGIENVGYAAQAIGSGIGQSFTGDGNPLTYCDFYLYASITIPTGIIYAKLYAHTGTFGTNGIPTGPVLATSGPVNASLVGLSHALIRFGFEGIQCITPTSGTKYVITLSHAEDASGNHVWASRTDNEGHLDRHDGNGSYKDSNWLAMPMGIDYIFHVYTGYPDPTPSITVRKNPFKPIFF